MRSVFASRMKTIDFDRIQNATKQGSNIRKTIFSFEVHNLTVTAVMLSTVVCMQDDLAAKNDTPAPTRQH